MEISHVDPIAQAQLGELSAQSNPMMNQDMAQQLKDTLKNSKKRTTSTEQKAPLDATKPLSIGMIDGNYNAKDILLTHAQKLSESAFMQQQMALQENSKQEIARMVEQELPHLSEVSWQASISQKPTKKTDALQQTPTSSATEEVPESTASGQIRTEMSKANKPAIQQALQSFISSYADNLIKPSAKKSQDTQAHLEKLNELKVPQSVILNSQATTRQIIARDIRHQMKSSFLEFALSYSSKEISVDMLQKQATFNTVRALALSSGAIANDPSQGEQVKNEAKEDLSHMIADELDKTIIQSKITSDDVSELIKKFDKFNDLAKVANFNSNEYMRHFKKKIEDYGLNYFASPHPTGHLDTDAQGSGGQQKGQQEPPQSQIDDIEDSLRHALVHSYTRQGGLRQAIANKFDILSKKRQLGELRSDYQERFSEIQDQAQALAKIRFMDMITEFFQQRATLLSLEGPEMALLNKQFKQAWAGLKKGGEPINKDTLRQMQHQANKNMFTILKEEYLKIAAYVKSNPQNNQLKQKQKDFHTILTRLKKESDIQEPIDSVLFNDSQLETTANIVEAA